MGNKIARTTQVSASEYYLHELPSTYNLVLKEVLGRGRFFKSIQCKHDEGLVLVKVYFKRGDSLDLSDYERRLSQIKEIFRAIDHPHVWPFQFSLDCSRGSVMMQFWQETDKAAYLLRQYFFHNLHDRLSTRPFLSFVEKKWLAFQLLLAVKQSHEKGVCHGDIKCENVLITSSNWLYLADFASFKPTYIPYDDPSDFSFFFDTGGRRLCYLAPESAFQEILKQMMNKQSSDDAGVTSGELLEEMVAKESVSFMKDSLMKREDIGKSLVHDHYELLGDINSLLRDAKKNNNPSGPQHVTGNAHNSNFPENLKNLQSPAIVRCAALETLCDILPLVRDFPPSDAKIFPEYILPMLSMLPDDPEESVRICYASNIAKLALTAYGFLIHSMSLSEAGVLDELSSPKKPLTSSTQTSGRTNRINSDVQLLQLRKSIAEVVQELVMGPKQTPNIRRALLQDIGKLCCFFGVRQSNDSLLPILPAFLNDRDEQLRTVFYEKIVYVCFFVGQRSVEEYLLPYIEQALSDMTEAVIVRALECLTILCKNGYFRKRILLQMIDRAFPLLCYPSEWVRRSAVAFIAASSESLGAVDSYVFLAPVIRPFLRRQPVSLASEKALLSCLKPPVSRQVFYEVLENSRSSDMLERQRKIWYSSSQSKLWEMDLLKKGIDELDSIKNWTDKQQGPGIQQAIGTTFQQPGLTDCDKAEAKLRDMGAFMHNDNNMVAHRDSQCLEKLQFSGFTSPMFSGVNSLTYEKPSEGIPLYSFSVDRRGMGLPPPAASDSPLQMNSLGVSSSAMPWVNPLSSFSISNGSKQFHRVVHEPDARENETAYVNNTFQDVGLSSNIKGTSISLEDATAQTDLSGFPSFARTSIPDSGWRPRGVLVAHLQEHRSAVNDIAISSDQSFFVSASDDSTVKIWDSRKLEKDISFRSKLTYHLEGSRSLCAAMLPGSAQVIIGASDGFIHMFSVDHISRGLGNVVEKYSGIADITKKDIKEGAILNLLNCPVDNYTIMYSTQNCGIHLWDTRSNSNTWTLKATPEEGYAASLASGPCGNWFVSGSSRGVITLWDLRFLIPVNSWKYSLSCPIEKMCLFLPPPNASLSSTARPLVYVAAGCNEVSLWNAENASCHQVLRAANYDSDAEMSDLPWALARPSSKPTSQSDLRRNINRKYGVDELNEPPPRLPGIRSLLPLPGGDLLTGGTDLKIRRWDHYSPDRSYCICGPNLKGVGNDDFYETKSSFGVQVVQNNYAFLLLLSGFYSNCQGSANDSFAEEIRHTILVNSVLYRRSGAERPPAAIQNLIVSRYAIAVIAAAIAVLFGTQETKRRPLATKLTAKAILAAAATDSAGCHRDSVVSLASVKLNQRLLLSSGRDGAIKDIGAWCFEKQMDLRSFFDVSSWLAWWSFNHINEGLFSR
ncbi:WD40-repeat-containing domain [Sesbania bispinosa]|nr:WD40-repeat-containing domain [Sesbania bispinosa]